MVIGPHVGAQRSYVPWLAVTAEGGAQSLQWRGGFWQRGSYEVFCGPRVPTLDRQGEGAPGGKQREMGGAWGEGPSSDGQGGGWQREAGIGVTARALTALLLTALLGGGGVAHRGGGGGGRGRSRSCGAAGAGGGPRPRSTLGGGGGGPSGWLRWLRRRDPRPAPASRVSPRPPAREPQPKSAAAVRDAPAARSSLA